MQQKIIFTLSLLFVTVASFAQSPELDSLRNQWKRSPTPHHELLLCEGFADYRLTDSVFAHTARLKQMDLSPSELVRLHFSESYTHGVFSDWENQESDLLIAFNLARLEDVDFCIASRVFERHHYGLATESKCYEGYISAMEYATQANIFGETQLEMAGLCMAYKMLACLEDSANMDSINVRIAGLIEQDPFLQGDQLVYMGDMFYYLDNIPMAVSKYTEAMLFYEKLGWEEDVFRITSYLGDSYNDLMDFPKSIELYEQCLEHIKTNELHNLSDYYNTLGWSYYRIEEYERALEYTKLSVRTLNKYNPGNPEIAYPIGNLGIIYKELGMLDSGLFYSNKAIHLFDRINYPSGMSEAHNNLGFICMDQGELDKAKAQFELGLELGLADNSWFDAMNAHEGLYLLNKELGNTTLALVHIEKYQRIKFQFDTDRDATLAQNLQARQLLESNEQMIQNLELEARIQDVELREQTLRLNVFILLSLTLLVLTFLFTSFWWSRRKLLRKLEASNQNNERIIRMISHDFRGPINNITSILEMLQTSALTREEFDAMISMLYGQSSNVSLLFDSFVGWAVSQHQGYKPSNETFEWDTMIEGVMNLVEPMARMKGVNLTVDNLVSTEVNSDKMAVSLILRNLISNSIKFTEAGALVDVSIQKIGPEIITTIRDEGVGMENCKLQEMLADHSVDQINGSTGLGIRMSNMYLRSLNGSIEGESELGKGTELHVRIPITEVHPSV